MTRNAVLEYVAALRPRYWQACRRENGRILDEVCLTTGLHRKPAIRLLRGRELGRKGRRGRPRHYGPDVEAALAKVWELCDRPCGKLLAPVLADLVGALERHGELKLRSAVREALLQMSPATIDRSLRKRHTIIRRQPMSQNTATPTLRSQIAIRTFGEWEEEVPGALQADLVLHCGESTRGFHLTALVAVDVVTGWTELEALWGMGKQRVGTGVHHIRQRLPFPLRSLHTDNGSEFINHVLYP